MIENKEHIILALQLINSNGETSFLVNLGYTYSEIAKTIGYLRRKKYIDFKSGKLFLTQDGVSLLLTLNAELNRKGISKFISPLLQYQTEKLDIFDVYFPMKKIEIERE